MHVRKKFPHKIRIVEHTWIDLADGTRLAARLWMPTDAGKVKYPALLEYHPYRKRDGTSLRDERTHGYFAGHGYVSVRVDVRGSGDSDGIIGDEYCKQEIDDAVEVVNWLAKQAWCTGDVGMFGLSWGGINTLATAARNPPALKAIISQGSTDDRFRDDCHFRGGCMVNEHIGWGSTMLSFFSWPPDPLLYGRSWRKTWLERLRKQDYPLIEWMRHLRRDKFWKQSSICEKPERMKTPLLYFGGWFDPYVNTGFRFLEDPYDLPLKVVVGPWAHKFPHMGFPKPAIGYCQEAIRWWDYWLKGEQNGIMDEPALRYYMMEGGAVPASCDFREGRWLGEVTWPSKHVSPRRFGLGAGRLIDGSSEKHSLSVCSPMSTGVCSGEHSPMAWGADLPDDQRADDAGSLCFDSDILTSPVEILGGACIDLSFSVDRSVAFVAARLCDINPDGFSTRIALGMCNLNHLDGAARPKRLVPGKRYKVQIAFENTAYHIPKAHRVRLALSTQYWPLVMPSPERVTMTVHTKGTTLSIHCHTANHERSISFAPPEVAPHSKRKTHAPEHIERKVTTDFDTGRTTYVVSEERDDTEIVTHGARTFNRTVRTYTILRDDPASAVMESYRTRRYSRGNNLRIRTEAWTKVTSTKKTFELSSHLEAYENNKRVFRRAWRESFPRDHV